MSTGGNVAKICHSICYTFSGQFFIAFYISHPHDSCRSCLELPRLPHSTPLCPRVPVCVVDTGLSFSSFQLKRAQLENRKQFFASNDPKGKCKGREEGKRGRKIRERAK